MRYAGYEFLWLFFVYAFLGWIFETIAAAVRQRRFVNRGLVNGPFCVIYGVGACLITATLQELSGFWLLLGSGILATVIEWIGGHLIERFYHEKWWDYSKMPGNLDGYVCLPVSVLWSILGLAVVKWGNTLLLGLFHLCPTLPGKLILWILTGLFLLDVAASLIIMSGRSRRIERWQAADAWIDGISGRLGKWIYGHVDARVRLAYPKAQKKEREEQNVGVFAAGCGFYKIAVLFFIGAFLGDVVETIFCRITAGVWMSRSSVVWGPFSIVWGLGIAGATAFLYKYKDRSEHFLFLMGTFLGGAYEYVCSVFTEIVFGTVFWDYSKIPLNLGGRINLLYCFFWGIAAVVWFKFLYPEVSGLIERIPVLVGKTVTWLLLIFMICNVLVSCMALTRYDERSNGIPATETWQQTIDGRFPDERMERIYPNALKVE